MQSLAAIPGLTAEQANILVHAGFLTLDDLCQVEVADLEQIEQLKGVGEGIVAAAKAEAARRNPVGPPNPVEPAQK